MQTVVPTVRQIGGPCMDVASDGEYLYTIQNQEQYPGGRVCRMNTEGQILCELKGIGNARQIGISGDTLVISARENGLWLVSRNDLSVCSHYQTVEFATGVTLCSRYAFISCRQFGLEIIDIGDPCRPVHIGLIRVGEVQSACIWNGYLFGGIWGGMRVAVVDIHDLSAPVPVAQIELQGRGDGVIVRDGILYAAIGQHRRGILNLSDENDPCYGTGNGYEVFDVHDLQHIQKLRTEYTETGYYPSFDTWKTCLSGDVLLVTNSILGLYAYRAEDGSPLFHVSLPSVDGKPDAATGVTVCGGKLFLAAGRGGLFAIDSLGQPYENLYVYRGGTFPPVTPHPFTCDSDRLTQVFSRDGAPVLDICKTDTGFALACGSGGLRVLDRGLRTLYTIPTDGFCCAVGSFGDLLFSAESDAGFSVYRYGCEKASRIAFFRPDVPVTQLLADPCGRYVLLGGGSRSVYAVDLRNLPALRVTAERQQKRGLLYGGNFASHLLADGTALMFWHRDGLVCYHPDRDKGFREIFYKRRTHFMGFGPENGIDTDGEHIYYNLDGGLIDLPMRENIFADELDRAVPEIAVRGKFILFRQKLIACERALGEITVTGIEDPRKPESLLRIRTNASCGKPVEIDGSVYIPAAHAGLLRLEL